MRASEIIRDILDLIDQIDNTDQLTNDNQTASVHKIQTGVDSNRFRQIFDIISADTDTMYDNSPAEVVTGIDSVTVNAGGGWNGPKNPADMKSNSISMYPNYQHRPE
jgi:hypothetical protein